LEVDCGDFCFQGGHAAIFWDATTVLAQAQSGDMHILRISRVAGNGIESAHADLIGLIQWPEGGLALSGDRRWLACGGTGPTAEGLGIAVYIWNLQGKEGTARWILDVPSGHISSVAFSPDGRTLLIGQENGSIALWKLDGEKLQRIAELAAHKSNVNVLVFSPDGKKLISGGYDHQICVWDWHAGHPQKLDALIGHNNWIGALAFTRDGRTLYSGGWDHVVRRWTAADASFRPADEFYGHSNPVQAIAFSPDGSRVATGPISDIRENEPNEVRIWRLGGPFPEAEKVLNGCTGWIRELTFSHDAQLLAAANESGVRCWDTRNWSVVAELKNAGSANSIVFAPDRRALATCWDSPQLTLTDFRTFPPKQIISARGVYHASLAFAPDGKTLAMASANGSPVFLLQPGATEFAARDTLKAGNQVEALAWSPDGRSLASANNDGTVCLWDMGAGVARNSLRGHKTVVAAVNFGHGGRVLASGDWDGQLLLWDVVARKLKQSWKLAGRIWELVFAPDGRHLAVSDGLGASSTSSG
jgi:WD40 repeat protein